MALRNQPYFPLYIQDYLTDEDLNMCSAASQGIFVKIMCQMHKSKEYGVILLKQKDKHNSSTYSNFAYKLAKLLPFEVDELKLAIEELVEETVLYVDGDKLCQKRMIRDNKISELRAEAGSKGGKKTQSFAQAKSQANLKQNAEYEIEDVNEDDNVLKNIVSIFDFWNEHKIITHQKLRSPTKNKIRTTLKDYDIDNIKIAIVNYSLIVNDDRYYFKYRWTLKEFLQKGLEKFEIDILIIKENYKKTSIKSDNRGTRRQAVTLSEKDKEQYR